MFEYCPNKTEECAILSLIETDSEKSYHLVTTWFVEGDGINLILI